ncbi:peptidase M4 [Paenibacillus sp. PK3_47]|uniref:PepSY domain-containing protein n=1 Tax=Paenibacillus sp. PK3_47 TaxID=2072642 RepID=UPI00201E1F5F|nr:PepSY domain-containing protein [Paenibacillus sp. PK3_47]UQZ34905.1 peptidase M4 [Paenibacillus sp. PK3_47]
MRKGMKVWGSMAAAAIILGGAYGINEVQGASAGTGTGTVQSQSQSKTLIGVEKAEALALKSAEGRVESIDFKERITGDYYKVEIRQANKEIDVRVDAYTGKILSVRTETDDDDDDYREYAAADSAQGSKMITAAKAAAAATASVQGKVTEIDLDEDDGRFIYEVEVRNGRTKTEVGVDAYTAKVLYTDVDSDDDSDDDDD